MGEQAEKQFAYFRQKQGRNIHRRASLQAAPKEEEPSKEVVKSFIYSSSSGSLFTFGQLSGFFFHTCAALDSSPTRMCSFFPGWIPVQRPAGWPWHHLSWGGDPFFLTLKEPFCVCTMFPLPQGWEINHLLIFHPKTGSSPSLFLP